MSAPHARRDRPHVAVIGAGPGGLAAAMQLAASGARVTLFEKDEVVGGRTRTLTSPEGYRFDLGPTFFLYPRILKEIFATCGADLDQEIDLIRLDPQYRLIFEGKTNSVLEATSDIPRMEAAIAAIAPGDVAGLRRFMQDNRRKLEVFQPFLERPFLRRRDMMSPGVMKSPAAAAPAPAGGAGSAPLLRRSARAPGLRFPDEIPRHVAVQMPVAVHHPELPRIRARRVSPARRLRRGERCDGAR
ncbi:FAD-dependent oxidoreductase, partial [Roseococcus sp.]|uniref:FAD-dependent oxidoreductase n=1 Tax=Roseococcus sp. TaxID=2109646 RepID=UPI003BAD4A1D